MYKQARYFVGVKIGKHTHREYEVFKTKIDDANLQAEYKDKYLYLVGAFRTKRGAEYMASNNACDTVATAERLAKLEKDKVN
jgi:hypothetical protein